MGNFGPDNNLDIDVSKSLSFSLDAGHKARLTFAALAPRVGYDSQALYFTVIPE